MHGCIVCAVNAAPVFTSTPKAAEILQGAPLELQCKALGRPRPDIHWYRGNTLLKNKKDKVAIESISNEDDLETVGSMSLSEVIAEDESIKYRIEAVNKVGKAEHVVSLTGERISIFSTKKPNFRRFYNYFWKILEPILGRLWNLFLEHFICCFQKIFFPKTGTNFSVPAIISVFQAPQFVLPPKDITVLEGEEFELKCITKGKPNPALTWLQRNGEAIGEEADGIEIVETEPDARSEHTASKLRVRHASIERHDGPMHVLARNVAGQERHTVNVTGTQSQSANHKHAISKTHNQCGCINCCR